MAVEAQSSVVVSVSFRYCWFVLLVVGCGVAVLAGT